METVLATSAAARQAAKRVFMTRIVRKTGDLSKGSTTLTRLGGVDVGFDCLGADARGVSSKWLSSLCQSACSEDPPSSASQILLQARRPECLCARKSARRTARSTLTGVWWKTNAWPRAASPNGRCFIWAGLFGAKYDRLLYDDRRMCGEPITSLYLSLTFPPGRRRRGFSFS